MMTMRAALLLATSALLIASATLAADDLSVVVAPGTVFSKFRTFAIRDQKIYSERPELDNPLFAKRLATTIRVALSARGLTHTTATPDLYVDYVLTGEDIHTSRPTPMRGVGPQPVRYTAGTLVIDLSKPDETEPVWRGVYRDDENTGSKLMQKLPDDARKLIDRYPKLQF
jgi:hypothetical protein